MKRRDFFRAAGAVISSQIATSRDSAFGSPPTANDPYAVLVDVDKCIGCRKCEWACNEANHLPIQPLATFEDKSIFQEPRRPDAGHYTVVNEYLRSGGNERPLWAKFQCMHCNDPACASACLVTAFQKQANGAVTYDSWRCMGCRYCMVACPFQIPAYEYGNALNPEIRKCTFCIDRISETGGVPACVTICPPQCLTFGKRSEVLAFAHRMIRQRSSTYQQKVYGEHEVGGTCWLYISTEPFENIGLPILGDKAPPRLTETIQHGIFKGFVAPVALFGLLGGIMRLFRPVSHNEEGKAGTE